MCHPAFTDRRRCRAHPAAATRHRPLLCTIRQDGSTGDWSAEDGEGNPCTVENGPNGLEIYRASAAEDQADPEIVGTAPPGAESLDALRRRIGPRAAFDRSPSQQRASQMRDFQRYLDKFYEPQ
jgi:hypothetical protein